MKQGQFEKQYGASWKKFEDTLSVLESQRGLATERDIAHFAEHYRKICHFHSLAKARGYSSYLVDQLGELIVRGHQQMYQRKHGSVKNVIRFFLVEFPALVRREHKVIWLAHGFLYIPGLLLFIAVMIRPEMAATVLDPYQAAQFEHMYDSSNRVLGEARDSETNWHMFGHYIQNNISVSFRAFASGLLAGVGSIFLLTFNSLLFGAVAGHLTNAGLAESFFTFVVAHGSFELTAIAISGAAGLKLGYSLLAPGNLTRLEALKQASQVAIRLVYGVIGMLVIAAFIEAFWSSNGLFEPWQKYLVGAALWAVVIAYLGWSGRSTYES